MHATNEDRAARARRFASGDPFRKLCLLTTLLVGLLTPALADKLPAVDYLRDVKPVLQARCYACHGAQKQQSDLRVDTAAAIHAGGESGSAIVPGNAAESLIVAAVTGNGMERMPKEGQPLSDEQIAKLRAWIDAGAPAPPDEKPAADPRAHWSFQPPRRGPAPRAADPRWGENPIDAFLAAEHARRGLIAAREAPRHVLLRRVSLDLVGVPPTRDQLHDFLTDDSSDAYERLVDRLLASPLYAERWARHWMDVWRYSDWDGFGAEVRESKPFVWRWRDWIVESLAADRPYDQMVREMLAGDELAPDDESTLRATGYLVRNWYMFNRNVWLDNTVEHTAKAFLGLTINCARCHDHKYDPIAQTDYYRFRAFFEPHQVRFDRRPGQPDTAKDGVVRAYDADVAAVTYLYHRGDDKQPDKEHPLLPGVPAALCRSAVHVEPVPLPATAYYPGVRSFVQNETAAQAESRVAQARAALTDVAAKRDESAGWRRTLAIAERDVAAAEAQRAFVQARIAADNAAYASPPAPDAPRLAQAASLAERVSALRAAEHGVLAAEQTLAAVLSGDGADEAKKKAIGEAEAKLLDAAKSLEAAQAALFQRAEGYTRASDVYPATSSGRRKALAAWITSPENPLAARVAINHIWLRHFYAPLVPTMFDFGLNGKPPSHPELLDWLAVELMENGWRMKPIHRLIVTSRAYRMQSSGADLPATNAAIDPDNIFLWRANVHRMEAEVVRDATLHLAGQLDCATGGPDLDPAAALTGARRSLYYRTSKEKRVVFLTAFDGPSAAECYRRSETVVPQQALAMVNSELSLSQSRRLAGVLWAQAQAAGEGAAARFVDAAFEQMLSRSPTAAEQTQCLQFLASQSTRLRDTSQLQAFTGSPGAAATAVVDPDRRARENLVHVLLNHNDFVTVR